jgi:hypothetical protein
MPLKGPSDYLFNLRAMSSSEAKRLWRSAIKDHWNNQCVYCGSNHDLTLDHVIPKARGGHNITSNVVPACRKCNQYVLSCQLIGAGTLFALPVATVTQG